MFAEVVRMGSHSKQYCGKRDISCLLLWYLLVLKAFWLFEDLMDPTDTEYLLFLYWMQVALAESSCFLLIKVNIVIWLLK